MKIGVAADHGGVDLKSALCTYLADRGAADKTSVDYPDYAAMVAGAI